MSTLKPNTRYRFKVRGRYPFPIDMLRYDRCAPYGEEDSHTIERSLRREIEEPVTVTLWRMWTGTPTTPDRWKSMGWEIVEFSAEAIV